MFDPTRGKLDNDFDESMRMLEKAFVTPDAPIEPRQPSNVLLVLDGSSQDEAVIDAGRYLRGRFDSRLLVIDARELDDDEPDEADSLQAASKLDAAELLPKGAGTSYEQILSVVESHEVDLVVIPCPFGRDFDEIGVDSAGTTIDVMLSRCDAPLLIIRRPDQELKAALSDISLLISTECEAEMEAAAWALGLANSGASISLEVVVNNEQFENLRQVLEIIAPGKELDADDLNKALADSHASLHAAMGTASSQAGVSYELVPKANETAPPQLEEEAKPLLIVLPCEVDDRFVQGFVHDRIRRSPHPLLVVSTHIQKSPDNS